AWLERGTASVRFTKPIHEGEEVLVAGAVTARDPKNLTATVTASTAAGGECATLTATLPAGSPVPLNLAQFRGAPPPPQRAGGRRGQPRRLGRPAPPSGSLDALGTPVNPYDDERAAEVVDRFSDGLALYRGARGWMHPAFI